MRHRPPQGSSSSSSSTSASSLLSISLALLSLLPSTIAADSVPQIPPIDFDALGALGVSGSFAGLQLWSPEVSSNNQSTIFRPSSSTLLSRLPNGTLSRIGSTEEDGRINSICQLNSPNNSGRRVFVGGKFDKIIGKGVSNVFSYDPGNQSFDDLLGGLDGQVDALYCDSEKNSIIFGGSFKNPVNPGDDSLINSRYLGSVAGWNETSKTWFPLQFGGLNGSISFISSGTNSSNLRFGGAFDVEYAALPGTNPNNQLNASSVSGTNTSSSALTSALTPLSLGQSEFTGGPPLNLMGFDDPAQILCPQGEDGPDNSYLFADGSVGRLTVRTFRPLDVRAIRLGNTFYQGRGTKTFGLVSIPDNTPLELTYLDPITDRNMTCTNNCTLTNETSIPYQDFLISQTESNGAVNGTKVLTGIEFTAYDHYGQGAGLHVLELLSEGAWSYAYGGYNRGSCSSPQLGVNGTVSNSTSEGGWYQSAVTVNNAVGGTIEAVMSLTDDYTNLQSNVGSSLTWNVDVPVDGNYSVYMFVPGCQALNECGMRTSVDVITRSNSSSPGNTTRISEVVRQDTSILVYDGEIIKTSSNFTPSVTLSIPADMPAPADGNRFTIIADKISLLLRNSNETFQGVKARGFGVFEFDEFDPLSQININGTLNATGTLPNITISDLSRFSVALLNNGVRGNESERIWTIQDCANQTFVGGNFTSDAYNATAFNGSTGTNILPANAFANLVYYNATTAGNVSILPGGGLNSAVYALTSVADLLYIGGNFTSTLDNSTILNYFAIYDPVKLGWTPILDGPTGPVRSLVPLPDGSILVSGDFDTINENGQVGGYGVFDPVKKTWLNQPELLVASINAASAPAPNGDANAESWLAGKVVALSKSKTSGGGAGLSQNDDTKMLEIKGLNFAFKGSLADGTTPKENNSMTGLIGTFRRDSNPLGRQVEEKVSSFGNWFSRAKSALPPISPDDNSRSSNSNKLSAQRSIDEVLIKRQGSSSSISALLPESLQSDGSNELLATAYWAKPGVNDVSAYPRIVGGNFTTTNGIKNIGYYDPTADGNAGALTALPVFPNEQGMNVTLVRSLLIVGNILYVGGDGGLVTMDLSATPLMWRTGSDSPAVLETDDDEENGQVQVISMVHRPDTDTIVVAGKFSSAGNLPCEGTCAWDQGLMRWASLRNGVQGQVEALDYANRDASLLIAAGSLSLNGVRTSLAGYDFIKQIWTPFGSVGSGNGQIPGPATAVSVDDLNADAIFVAGRTSDGSAPFLVKWDGTSYQPVGGNELQSESGISQLTFFPISQAHPSNNVIEQNRVLVVSGALLTNSFGNLSSALFDGESWIPFLISTSNNGMNGIIRGLQRSTEVIRYPNLHRLAVGIVILISIALGLGVVFLLVLIGLVWALARRRSEPQPVVAASHPSQDTLTDGEDMAAVGGLAGAGGAKKRPSSLLATLNAATENVVSMSHPSGGTEGSGMVSYGAPVAGGAAAAAALNQHNRNESMGQPTTLDHSDETAQTGRTGDYYSGAEDGNYEDAYDQDAAGLATAAAVGDHSRGIPAHARYSFEATHESELGVRAGQSLEILDDGDEHWWLIMDENGRRGVVPATYIL